MQLKIYQEDAIADLLDKAKKLLSADGGKKLVFKAPTGSGKTIMMAGGLVFEQVCLDLEASGYEVQPFIIPAVAVNAPHRRDRVWFIAHRKDDGGRGRDGQKCGNDKRKLEPEKQGRNTPRRESQRRISWSENWLEVATSLCGMDDGLPIELDGFKLTKAGHRTERLKALGNAIVPQVAIEILQAIKNCQ